MTQEQGDSVVTTYTITEKDVSGPFAETTAGEFKVTAIAENPVYHYNPELNLRNVDVQERLDNPPGPNNPVGLDGST